MIMGQLRICPKCRRDEPVFWTAKQNMYMCNDCQREYNPPRMTLIEGTSPNLWNLEVGREEAFSNIEDIEWCGWIVKCKQKTVYSRVPRVVITVYHMEFHGTAACGRCIKYPFFTTGMQDCMSVACEPAAKPPRAKEDINYPKVKSKYAVWTGLWEE